MLFQYTPQGVCSRRFEIDLRNGVIEDIRIEAGCSGNLQGIASLVKGLSAREAADRLRGIHCGGKRTSCPDQLSRALEEALLAEQDQEEKRGD